MNFTHICTEQKSLQTKLTSDTWVYFLPGNGDEVGLQEMREKAEVDYNTALGRIGEDGITVFVEESPALSHNMGITASPCLCRVDKSGNVISKFIGIANEQQLFTIMSTGLDPR